MDPFWIDPFVAREEKRLRKMAIKCFNCGDDHHINQCPEVGSSCVVKCPPPPPPPPRHWVHKNSGSSNRMQWNFSLNMDTHGTRLISIFQSTLRIFSTPDLMVCTEISLFFHYKNNHMKN